MVLEDHSLNAILKVPACWRKPVWVAEAVCPLMWLLLIGGYAEPEAVLNWAMNWKVQLTGGIPMLGSDVSCPGGRQPLPEEGADPEAVLEAGMTTAAVGAEVWSNTR